MDSLNQPSFITMRCGELVGKNPCASSTPGSFPSPKEYRVENFLVVSCFWWHGQPIVFYWEGSSLATVCGELPTRVMNQSRLFHHWCNKSLSSNTACFKHFYYISCTKSARAWMFSSSVAWTTLHSLVANNPTRSLAMVSFIGSLNTERQKTLPWTRESVYLQIYPYGSELLQTWGRERSWAVNDGE